MNFTCVSEDALRMIANGKTAAEMTARAADPSSYDHYRSLDALREWAGADLAKWMTRAGDDLAAEMNAFDKRLADAMAALESDGWTPSEARAALRDTGFRLAAGPLREEAS
jgi:hypothetical protein